MNAVKNSDKFRITHVNPHIPWGYYKDEVKFLEGHCKEKEINVERFIYLHLRGNKSSTLYNILELLTSFGFVKTKSGEDEILFSKGGLFFYQSK